MPEPKDAIDQVRQVLDRFQEFYIWRDPTRLDEFMELLLDEDIEVIGTNGIHPGQEEWHFGKDAARELFLGDWQTWGDLRLDVPAARIRIRGEVAWLSALGAVQMNIPAEQSYTAFLERVKQTIAAPQPSAEQKLLYILRGGSNTVYELRRGEQFTWPLRFTAVLRRQAETWKFVQMLFSYPTVYFPDVRLLS